MTVAPGTTLGPYKIDRELGRGGMGVVYLGRDTRLDRDVAIKALPQHLAQDPDRLVRFEREAKTLAQLNHPNVAGIHGVEEHDGARYLVLEFVEGETLASRLDRGPLPVDEVLEIGVQVAAGIEAAHEAGVIHRDLKPGNIIVSPDGQAKVLDFGLARAVEASSTGMSPTDATVTSPAMHSPTMPGVILGTAAYMSPEQARGRPLDKRTDIWSFGVILYECMTRETLFRGETVTDSLGAILHKDPDWSSLPPGIPPTVQLLLRRCLTKDRKRRLHDIADARIELESAIADPTASSLGMAALVTAATDRSPWPSRFLRTVPWLVALGAIALMMVTLAGNRTDVPETPRQVARLTIPVSDVLDEVDQLAIDPEGRYVVYRSVPSGLAAHLNIRYLNDFTARTISDAGGWAPFISPDGREIGFFDHRSLRVTTPSAGSSRLICEAFGDTSGTWGEDGTIVFSTGRPGDNASQGLSIVPSSGGSPKVLTTADRSKNERAHKWPTFLPDGKYLLFTILSEMNASSSIAVLSLETGKYETILRNAAQPIYLPTGHLVYYNDSSDVTMAVAFDAKTRRVLGDPIQVDNDPKPGCVVSRNGTLAYLPWADTGGTVIMVDLDGNETPIIARAGSWVQPRISPDGRYVVIRQEMSPDCFLWLYDLDRATLTRLTFEGDSHYPTWCGSRYVYAGLEGELLRSIYRMPVDGSAAPELVWKGNGPEDPGRGSLDGSLLPFSEENNQGNKDIWVLSLRGKPEAHPFLQTQFDEHSPAMSPDGKWLANTSDESGHREVYVRPYPGPGVKLQVSRDGGEGPAWSSDGKTIYYVFDQRLMSAEFVGDPNPNIGEPRKLLEMPFPLTAAGLKVNYDVAPDGKHFVMIKPQARAGARRDLKLVLNWSDELVAKVPTGGTR